MITAPALSAWALMPAVLPIALWVAHSDLSRMIIPNRAVLALIAVFALIGVVTLGLPEYGWRWAQGAIALVICFVLNAARLMGGGDAKFIAAMALFIAPMDWGVLLMIFTCCLLGGYIAHRLLRRWGAVRALAPDWVSWHSGKYPMGLSLAGALVIYLGLAALWGA